MFDRLIYFSIKNKLIIGLLTIGLIIWGVYSLTRLPIDAVPDITNNQVQVITVAPSQSAQDIERLITFTVEQTMATIPDVSEIRSISRFGLSVVTIVFHDEVDVYWARQQVNERLSEAQKNIPAGIGNPEMAPVTTGLGEIYQYILRPKKGYEHKYDLTELRTLQDWIVRRQLLGTQGVADVSSFGGYLKQYEIALEPDKLRSFGLSIMDIFAALKANNQNTGGTYIEKDPNAWFIRSEGLIGSLSDIEKVVIKRTEAGMPVLVRDIAQVRLGHAPRFGAMTYNDKGEVVGGIVLMLKGENSNAVVHRVKERMHQIEKTLPEGLEIDAFLDRSKLVDRAIGTVEKNLLEGALIVIAVLVLFLGNLRAGIVVASVIPLSMLFAVGMMNLFGVSGNLMSLGAIDFGLIVDGAVIIVEAIMHHLGVRGLSSRLTQTEMDDEVYHSASRIRTSAAFGEIIILIVYLPILALVGIEGKMFKPMAQTVSFAILGAFILSLTYVPMMSALLLSKKTGHKRNISDRMMDFFHRLYSPLLERTLKYRSIVVTTALALFAFSLFLFMNMGGEFLPTLEEGDFAVETRILPGSSLSETVKTITKASQILQREFPDEIKEVVGKVGSSEIPVDPMPIESGDMMIILNDKDQWKKAGNREELVEKMSSALDKIPGVSFGFQQPIQMRFNELMTGAKQDVVIKIFGESLDTLTNLSKEVARIVQSVEGAEDIYLEKATGLSQIVIRINRDQIAKYGLSVDEINETVNAGFAGKSAGIVYEGEKRFDLVVRLSEQSRQTLVDVRNLYIPIPGGGQVPLSHLADVDFKLSPNQIQREDAKRRIIVAFNVRGRDVAAIVKEIQKKIEDRIKFPSGYYPTYGGQFENLEHAQARLSVAVPAALLLIFVLLFFTFGSFRQALLIFSAIPLAAIGGVFALLLRDMPFSISAGVGFIALFGVAVLNGIVLIAEFNRQKKEGVTELKEIIMRGANVRLRPVLMTASVASLGFLPMALSNSGGAEVQKPLATVVIGGLITSTLLTLLVLPCLYILFEKFRFGRKLPAANKTMLLALILLPVLGSAQQRIVSVDSAVSIALQNNKGLAATRSEIAYYARLKKTSSELPKTSLAMTYGQYNSFVRRDNNFTISQTIPFPTVFGARSKLGSAQIKGAEFRNAATRNELIYQVRQTYYLLLYFQEERALLKQQDSLLFNFLKASELRLRTGEGTLIEKTAAETRRNEVLNLLVRNTADMEIYKAHLGSLLGITDSLMMPQEKLKELNLDIPLNENAVLQNPNLAFLKQQIEIAERIQKLTSASILPDITAGYFNQSLINTPLTSDLLGPQATSSNRFQGFHVGLSVPIWFAPYANQVKAEKIRKETAALNFQYGQTNMQGQFRQAVQQYFKQKSSLEYYRNSALPNADLLLRQAQLAFRNGESGYLETLILLQQVLDIRKAYLLALDSYNQSILELEFLSGKNQND